MTNWPGIAELLGMSAVLIGAITGVRSLVMLFFPEKKFKSSGIRQKQALIVDSANFHSWTDVLGITLITCAGVAVLVKTILKIQLSFVDMWAVSFAMMAPLSVAVQSRLSILEANRSRKMGKALEEKGFEVSITHKANVDWEKLLNGLAQGADDATISLVRIFSHGSMISRKSFEFEELQKKEHRKSALYESRFVSVANTREKFSVLGNGNMPDYALIAMLPQKGKTVLAVNACQAGGMVEAAGLLTGKERENVSVMTSTDHKLGYWNNPQAKSLLRYIRHDSGTASVSEFFEKHCREQSGRRRFMQPIYRPMQFSGKNMRITL